MPLESKPASQGSQQKRADAWVRRAAALSDASSLSDSGDYELQTLLIDTLLATEPFWSKLPCPAPLFGEEFLQAVLKAAEQDAS